MKNGIILAGGTGSRLFPLTHVVNKHLLGVNGNFIIDYPVNTLKQMGVENLTVVLGGNHFSQIVDHLKDGRTSGMNINYVYQGEAKGIAQAINLCQRFVNDKDQFAVILGDNIFENKIEWQLDKESGQHIPSFYEAFKAQIVLDADKLNHPELKRFGMATIENDWSISSIVEKPQSFDEAKGNYPITGCYLFDQQYFEYFRNLKPSARGEYEIVDILNQYREHDQLKAAWHENGLWSDAGTHESIEHVNKYFYEKKQKV